jgi:hypothetical protein
MGNIWRRVVYAVSYAAMATSGTCALIWPAPAVSRAANGAATLITVWAVMLIAGGFFGLVGAIRGRWLGEFVGLPLLVVVFMVYGLGAFANGMPASRAGAFALSAIGTLIAGRWIEVNGTRRQAVVEARKDSGG